MKRILSNFASLYKCEPLIMFLLSWLLLSGSTISIYAALILVPYVIVQRKIKKGIDNMFILIMGYSVCYTLFSFFNGYYQGSLSNIFFQSLFPPVFYLIGKWMVRSKTEDMLILFFLILVGFIAVPVIIDVINDIRENQFINVMRNLETEDGSTAGSATNLGVRVSLAVASIGVLMGKCNTRYEYLATILFFIVAAFGITCILHLINRTGIIIAVISLLAVLSFNVRKLSKKNLIIIFAISLAVAIYYVPRIQFATELKEVYEHRNDKDSSSASSAGGRTDLWLYGLKNIYKSPFGVDISNFKRYAHNYWLDTSLRGGFLALLFLFILTIKHIRNSWFVIKRLDASLLRTLIITTNIGFFLTALVEPIMEGFQVYVFLLFLFIGIVQQLKIFSKDNLSRQQYLSVNFQQIPCETK